MKCRYQHIPRDVSVRYRPSIWACSSVGRAPALHAGCRRFEPYQVHHTNSVAQHPKSPRIYTCMETFLFDNHGKKRKAVELTCDGCNKPFLKRADMVSTRNFCSVACKAFSQKEIVIVECAYCNNTFNSKKSADRNSKSGLRFCSRKCKDTAQRIQSGFKAIQPSHYSDSTSVHIYRSVALRNYPNQCHHCGYDEHIELLQVHHIDSDRANNALGNLVILCPTHHWAITIGKAVMGSDRVWVWIG